MTGAEIVSWTVGLLLQVVVLFFGSGVLFVSAMIMFESRRRNAESRAAPALLCGVVMTSLGLIGLYKSLRRARRWRTDEVRRALPVAPPLEDESSEQS